MNKKFKTAFSLIELSIVIIVISIMIAGVLQGRNIILNAQIKAARSLTRSSPVSSIMDLELWLETSLEESVTFNADGNVTSWNDINPQSREKHNATPSASVFTRYKENAINGLPAMYYDGTNNGFDVSDIPLYQRDNTIFIVERHVGTNITGCLICSGSAFSFVYLWEFGGPYVRHNNHSDGSIFAKFWSDTNPNKKLTYILSTIEDYDTSYKYYVDYEGYSGSNSKSISGTADSHPELDITIGYGSWNAVEYVNIAEVIIYSRALKAKERRDVVDYLKQKYGVN